MTDKYINSGGKVYQATEINVSQKIASLQDTLTQLNNEIDSVNAEITELDSKK